MMRVLFVAVAAVALAGCETMQTEHELPRIAVAGPIFPASRFNCGNRPVPPDPKRVGAKAASAAAKYEGDLKYWGQVCANKLQSVGKELDAAGQVAR